MGGPAFSSWTNHIVALALVATACSKPPPAETGGPGDSAPAAASQAKLNLFAFGRVKGHVAPCGCTTEPLGGLAYAFGIVEAADKKSSLVLEPGSLLFPDPDGPEPPEGEAGWAQARKRAEILHERFSSLGGHLVSGLGPLDVVSPDGAAVLSQLALPRVVANAAGPSGTEDQRLFSHLLMLEAGGKTVPVGVTAVVDPSVPGADKLGALTDPVDAVRKQVASMKKAGATITVAMVHGPRPLAEQIAREIDGLHFVVVGYVEGLERQRLGTPVAKLNDTFVLEPGEQLQTISHVSLSFPPGADLSNTQTWTLQTPRSVLQDELARLEERLAKFAKDPSADPAFVARLEQEREGVKKKIAGEGAASGVSILVEQQKVTCHAPADPAAKKALSGYDAWVAAENKTRFAGVKPPPPGKGEAGYVGIEECSMCHDEAAEFWKTTKHAGAYETLVSANKQFDLSCVGCHVTGFREPGGSEVVENEGLVDVQCEVCHGAGSIHVEEPERKGTPHKITREAPEEVCGACHTPDHSDTFDYTAYLRDILGPGHGEEARKALGDGPTGAQLRAAGLAKAGGSCKKM